MKSYSKAMQRKHIKNAVREEKEFYAEHYDLVLLWLMHTKYGFGAKRLREFYRDYVELYTDFKNKYYCKDDIEQFGSRTDAYVLKQRLNEIGFNYDTEVKELHEGAQE